ncbi:catecholate siderophore receptor Fiu [Massilia phosphatilytica]
MRTTITSRKHSFTPRRAGALALLMLPLAGHAADADADGGDRPHRVHVTGARDNDYKADQAQSAKYTEKLVDTAQTVIAIKKELFEQQGATTLTEALRNTPGVGTFFLGENGSTNTGDAVYMRGFDTSGSLFVDGIRDIGSVSRDVFNIEQIDVLKGPAGTDTGRGAPTGSINLDTKQPRLKNFGDASLTAGSADRVRATADINRVIDRTGGTAFRLNVLDQGGGNAARDDVREKRWAIAPSLAFGLHGPTHVYLDYLHVRQDNRPDGGVPTIGLPGYTSPDATRAFLSGAAPVDPRGFYGALSDFDRVTADMATAIIEHEFRNGMRLKNTSRYGKTKQFYLLSAFMGTSANIVTPSAADPSTWSLARTTRTIKDQENTVLANQTTLTTGFGTGALRHTLVAGLDLSNEKQSNRSYVGGGTLLPANLYHPDPASPVTGLDLQRSGARTQGESATASGYLLDTIKFGDNWIFNASARLDHFDTTYDAIALSTATSNPALPVGTPVPTHIELSDNLASGKVSALYKPTATSSVYALWANSKNPPGSNLALSGNANSAANPIYEPQVSTTTEVGAKWEVLDRRLALNAALYRTDVKNEVEQDPVDLKYYQTGKKRVQGIELAVTGEITRAWSVNAGYTYMDTSIEAGRGRHGERRQCAVVHAEAGLDQLDNVPAAAWLHDRRRRALPGQAAARQDGAVGTPAYADAYWVADAVADYRVNRWLDVRLNVYNLFDKDYVAAINKSGYR